jgi:hypothetical protein
MFRHLTLLAFLAFPAGAQEMTAADCAALATKIGDLAASMSVTVAGGGVDQGECVFQGVGYRSDRPGGPEWRAERIAIRGGGPAGSFADTGVLASVSLDIQGLTIAPAFPDPVPAHLVGLPPLLRGIDATLGLYWESADQSLSVSRLLVDFPGDDALDLTARVINVDTSSLEGAMIGLGSFLLTDAEVKITSRGLFTALVTAAMGPKLAADDAARDEALAVSRQEATTWISQLPQASFSMGSRMALRTLVADLPDPVGTLRIKLRSETGIGPASLMRFALTGAPATLEDLQPLFDGLRVDVAWPRALGQ